MLFRSHYEVVHRLARDFPDLTFVINGGFKTLAAARAELDRVSGVMIGREAYHNPWLLARADTDLFRAPHGVTVCRDDIVKSMIEYAQEQQAAGTRLHHIARHMLGLYQGLPGARQWRRTLSAGMHQPGADAQLLERALTATNNVLHRTHGQTETAKAAN